MPERPLTDEIIAEAMERPVKVACGTDDSRCFGLPDPLALAHETCDSKGRCMIGWIIADSGRKSWDVWLDTNTGEGRLRKQAESR